MENLPMMFIELMKEKTKHWTKEDIPLKDTDVYLGDGLYASFDGYQIAIKANCHYQPTDTIFLDFHVVDSFLNYLDFLKKKINAEQSKVDKEMDKNDE